MIFENKIILIRYCKINGFYEMQADIKNMIYQVRGVQVMLDSDLAQLFNVETKVFNQAAKRNSERFPDNFMFQLTKNEYDSLRSQFVTSNDEPFCKWHKIC